MPDIPALIQYISERRIKENSGSGYSFVRDLPPNIKDTFFGVSCLKMLNAESNDDEIVRFLSGYDNFDFNGAYYAMKCLKLAGAEVQYQNGLLRWLYKGKRQARPCAVPSTPLIRYLKYEVYGAYGSSIFSSPLSALLKLIELCEPDLSSSLANSVLMLLSNSRIDIMTAYIALKILKAISMRCSCFLLPSTAIEEVKAFLSSCTTHRGYVASPTSSSATLDSTYAGHKIARYIGIPDPLGISGFIDSLQNENGGFRQAPFGGISTLESCYLAISIISDYSCAEHEAMK
ncbi:MAG: hypothetical protein WB392_07550 [Methanotrichaceae archaeon]